MDTKKVEQAIENVANDPEVKAMFNRKNKGRRIKPMSFMEGYMLARSLRDSAPLTCTRLRPSDLSEVVIAWFIWHMRKL